MNLQQFIFFVLSSFALSQNYSQQQQYNNQQQYYSQQPYTIPQSITSSYYDNYHPSGQYRQSLYSANVPVNNDFSSYRQEHMSERQNAAQSISSYAAAMGYSNPASIPDDVRKSIIASYLTANSDKVSQRIQSASAFMATQTQINTSTLAQAISSIAATATGKKKGMFDRFKMKKTQTTGNSGIAATATSGLNNGFKNFFKSIQMKIQKSSTTTSSSIAPTSTA
jgi:hypothetical protein